MGRFAGVVLGPRRRDVQLSDSTIIAIVPSFDDYPDVIAKGPDAFCGTVKARDEDGHIDAGDGWRVSGEIVDLVEFGHGYLTWAASKALVEGTNRQAGVVECAMCWAWDASNKLVAIVAPLMQEEAAS